MYCNADITRNQSTNDLFGLGRSVSEYHHEQNPKFLSTNLSCPVITSAANAVDRNLFNYTAVNFPLISLLSSVSLTMNVSQPVTNGSGGGVYMQALTGFGCSG